MTHIVLKEQTEFKALQSGKQPFFIHRINRYSIDPGEKIIFQETKDGEHTGEEWTSYADFITDEGLMKGRQAISIKEKEA